LVGICSFYSPPLTLSSFIVVFLSPFILLVVFSIFLKSFFFLSFTSFPPPSVSPPPPVSDCFDPCAHFLQVRKNSANLYFSFLLPGFSPPFIFFFFFLHLRGPFDTLDTLIVPVRSIIRDIISFPYIDVPPFPPHCFAFFSLFGPPLPLV